MSNIIIDNGSYEIKYGQDTDDTPTHVQNCVVRTNDRRVLLGSALEPDRGTVTDYSGIHFKRPIEHGQLTQWSVERQIWDNSFTETHFTDDWLKDCNLIYCETPLTLPKFQNMTDEVLFEEYEVNNLYRCASASLIPWMTTSKGKYSDFQLVIDSGFDSTWIIPIAYGLPYWKAVRKLPVGGRLLNGYLREILSFRHYNVMDEMVLVNNIKEKTCYVTEDYDLSLKKVDKLRSNRALKDTEGVSVNYVLPDYKTSNIGYTATDAELEKIVKRDPTAQSLKLYDERFAIPELLFHPELAGLHKSGLIATVKRSLQALPELLRPLMTANVVVAGGTFNMPGFQERLENDLKQEIPIDNEIVVHDLGLEDMSEVGWQAGRRFFEKDGFGQVSVSRDEYNEFGAEYTQTKFGFKNVR